MIVRRVPRICLLAGVVQVFASVPCAAKETASLNPMGAIDKAALDNVLERPLFDPTRRLPPPIPQPVAVVAPVTVAPPPPLHLLGVIRGRQNIAIVARDGLKKTTILRTGDRIGEWILTVVPPAGVRLRNGQRSVDYALFGKGAVDIGPAGIGPVAARSGVDPVASDPATFSQADAVGLPLVMPVSALQISPDF